MCHGSGRACLCGRRYACHAEETADIKVYSNQSQVSLYRNGELFATQVGSRVFVFEQVPLEDGFTWLTAAADGCSDTVTIELVEEKPGIYTLPPDEDDGDGVINWFEKIETVASDAPMEFSDTHFSVHDKIKDILAHDEAARILSAAFSSMSGMKLKKSMLSMMQDKTVIGLSEMFNAMGNTSAPDNALQIINAELNKIQKH